VTARAVTSPPEALVTLLDELIERSGEGEEVVRAREEWEARTAKLFEEDELYETRAAAFLEWFAIERPRGQDGVPPVVAALRAESDPARKAGLRAWAASHRSLFAIDSLEPGRVALTDLVAGGVFEVDERRKLPGVKPGDLVEARVVGLEDRVIFGRTFLYHPAEARPAIVALIGKMRAQGASRVEIVDALAAVRLKADRYKHMAPERVYSEAVEERK
jgi:hypothetical protein